MTAKPRHHDSPMTLAEGLSWPESPRWHGGALWFSDVHNFRLMKMTPGQAPELVAHVPGRPAGLGFMPDGRLLLASALDRRLWWVDKNGSMTLAVDLSKLVRGLLNDMVVDACGRAWVGDTGFDLVSGEPEAPGALVSWMPGEQPRIAATELRFPNGVAVAADQRTLYLAETCGQCISAYDISPRGDLSSRRLHAHLSSRPDGLCLDAEGGAWVALLWDGKYQRIDARGMVTDEILLSGERAISCVLAGAQARKRLFLGVACIDDRDTENVKRDGRIRVLEANVAGAGVP